MITAVTGYCRTFATCAAAAALTLASAAAGLAQTPAPAAAPPAAQSDVTTATASTASDGDSTDDAAGSPSKWRFMRDGALFAGLDDQGGLRGAKQFRSQNWWMFMGMHPLGNGTFTFTTMLSLEPLTATPAGYKELFQEGEAYKGLPNIDRQHPHDFLMQASASWRFHLGSKLGMTIAGAPVGEAALGPVAFMHRASAAENPTAPLSHHTFDSTHETMGVVSAALDLGPWMAEGSWFQGREPDDNRWNPMDAGKLDSYSGRLSYRSGPWYIQVSSGYLTKPERLENIDVRRTTASASWTRIRGDDFLAFTAMVGENVRPFDTLHAEVVEGTDHKGRWSAYGRFEHLDVETESLLFPLLVHKPHPFELIDPLAAFTLGAVFDFAKLRGYSLGVGADITTYKVPPVLKLDYGDPVSFHVFFRLRLPSSSMGHMFNATMLTPMGHKM